MISWHIYGRDYAGFQDSDHAEPFSSTRNQPLNVKDQLDSVRAHINHVQTNGLADDDGGHHKPFDFIVLMGHSFGTYLAMLLIHDNQSLPPSSALPLRHAFLLFPTLSHIALSPQGRIITRLLNILSPGMIAWAARTFIRPCPSSILLWILQNISGQDLYTAKVTEALLKSRDGVMQMLWLAKDEMEVIGEDIWGDLWSSHGSSNAATKSAAAQQTPRFFMLFGKNDEWVNNKRRDGFIAKTKHYGSVRAVIDAQNLPHAFCATEGKLRYRVFMLVES